MSVAINKALGAEIRRLRTNKGMSQEALGDACGITFQQIQKYEKGSNQMSVARLVQVCDILETPAPDVLAAIVKKANNGRTVEAEPGDRKTLELIKGFNLLEAHEQQGVRALINTMAREQK